MIEILAALVVIWLCIIFFGGPLLLLLLKIGEIFSATFNAIEGVLLALFKQAKKLVIKGKRQ